MEARRGAKKSRKGEAEGLAMPVIVHRRPGDHRPVVIELPDQGAGIHWLQRAQVLHPESDNLCLLHLTGPVPVHNVLPAVARNQPGMRPIRTMAVDHAAVADVIEVTRSQVGTHAPGDLDVASDGLLMDQCLGAGGVQGAVMVQVP